MAITNFTDNGRDGTKKNFFANAMATMEDASFEDVYGKLAPVLARYAAPAVTRAPFIPSGWLWVTAAVASATSIASSRESAYHTQAETRIAEPFPKLLYGSVRRRIIQDRNLPPYPA